jgi:hypothetical protein
MRTVLSVVHQNKFPERKEVKDGHLTLGVSVGETGLVPCTDFSLFSRGVYRVLVEKHEGKKPLGRPRRTWEDRIKMYLQEVGCGTRTGSIWLRIGTGGKHV